MKAIETLKLWLKLSECTVSNTYIGTRPEIREVENMLAELEQVRDLVKKMSVLPIACSEGNKADSCDKLQAMAQQALTLLGGVDEATRLNKAISERLIKQHGDDYETAVVYTNTFVDCPYCEFTQVLENGGAYDQQVCCCQKCDKYFIMLA